MCLRTTFPYVLFDWYPCLVVIHLYYLLLGVLTGAKIMKIWLDHGLIVFIILSRFNFQNSGKSRSLLSDCDSTINIMIVIEHNFVTYNVNAQNLFSQFYYYFFFISVFFSSLLPYDLISNKIMEPSLSRLIWHKGEKNYVWFAFLTSIKNVDNWVLRVHTFRMEAWQVY